MLKSQDTEHVLSPCPDRELFEELQLLGFLDDGVLNSLGVAAWDCSRQPATPPRYPPLLQMGAKQNSMRRREGSPRNTGTAALPGSTDTALLTRGPGAQASLLQAPTKHWGPVVLDILL